MTHSKNGAKSSAIIVFVVVCAPRALAGEQTPHGCALLWISKTKEHRAEALELENLNRLTYFIIVPKPYCAGSTCWYSLCTSYSVSILLVRNLLIYIAADITTRRLISAFCKLSGYHPRWQS